MQAWLSPWQVAHLLSIISTIKESMPEVGDVLPPEPAPGEESASRNTSNALNTQLRVTATLEIPILSVLCLVRATDSAFCQSMA